MPKNSNSVDSSSVPLGSNLRNALYKFFIIYQIDGSAYFSPISENNVWILKKAKRGQLSLLISS